MSTQPPEPPNEDSGDEPIDRIDELEERLAGIEEALRMNAIEDSSSVARWNRGVKKRRR